MFVETAKVMSKGQVTIPKEIRDKLGLSTGDRVLFVFEDNQVKMMNPSIYAMRVLQNGMKGEADKLGITDVDVNDFVSEIRNED